MCWKEHIVWICFLEPNCSRWKQLKPCVAHSDFMIFKGPLLTSSSELSGALPEAVERHQATSSSTGTYLGWDRGLGSEVQLDPVCVVLFFGKEEHVKVVVNLVQLWHYSASCDGTASCKLQVPWSNMHKDSGNAIFCSNSWQRTSTV